MAFNIRQMISGLFPNSENEKVNRPLASPKSLLDKLGAVFNLSAPATTNKNSFQSNTALRNVSTQVNLSNADINNQLRREAVRTGVVQPTVQTDDNSNFYLAGGYKLFPEEIDVAPQTTQSDAKLPTTQSEVMRLAYGGFAGRAKLSAAGAREFVERRMAETGGRIYPPNRPDVPYSDTEFAAQTATGKISLYANDSDAALLKAIKTREQEALEPDAPSVSARNATTVEQITNTVTDTLDSALGTDANSIGGTMNRIGVSALHVAGDAAAAVGAQEAANTLHNANSGLTRQEQVIKAKIQASGYDVPLVAKIAQEAENTPEFVHDVIEGATLGDFSEKETYGANAGKILGGLNPIGDVRDVVANSKNVAENKPGSYVGLGASILGAIPVAGDVVKPIIKTEKKVITELAEDALKTEGKEVVEQVAKEEAEKLAKAEAEKLAKAEAEKLAKEEAEKAAKIEAERLATEQAEKAAQSKAVTLEKMDGGHSIDRHGPELTEQQLKDRITKGVAADGVFSPTPASTRFNTYEDWLETRSTALKEIERVKGVDLSKPPTGSTKDVSIIVEHGKAIDDGFVGEASSKVKVFDPTNPTKKGNGYNSYKAVDGITRTKTTVVWDAAAGRWKVAQHFPLAEGWDNATKTYNHSVKVDSIISTPKVGVK